MANSTTVEVQSLLSTIRSLEEQRDSRIREIAERKRRVGLLQAGCAHDFTPPEWCGERREAYVIRGDRPGDPGYGGVDRQFDTHVPAKTTDKWKRTCKLCLKVEITDKTESVSKPKF